MATAKGRNDPVRIFMRRVWIASLFAVVVLLSIGVWGIYQKDQESKELNVEAQSQLAGLVTREDQMNADIANLQTEEGKEAALREQYNMGAPGEQEVMIVEPASTTPVQASSTPFQAWLHNTFPWW